MNDFDTLNDYYNQQWSQIANILLNVFNAHVIKELINMYYQ